MKTILITGSGGLVGREASEFFLNKGFRVIGIDNNLRKHFFGEDGNIEGNMNHLKKFANYDHRTCDIRNQSGLELVFQEFNSEISVIIHCAAQPSHDWAVKDPLMDFNVNATGTLNLLELTRKYCEKATFIFMSTNKVYGDNPNKLNLIELDTRYEISPNGPYLNGIDETFSIDNTKHSLFGCSKLAADIYVQEYGKYFGMNTVVFRGGCLTGSKHKGAELHGFLNYLVKCNLKSIQYNIYGYKGKQVRDNIHSFDLVTAFNEVIQTPRSGEVYNIGGSRYSNCSVLEAIKIIEDKTKIPMKFTYMAENRIGDHIWWISDVSKFKTHYPTWNYTYDLTQIIDEIINNIEK
jgi:CDP-paratose 2-epimerase